MDRLQDEAEFYDETFQSLALSGIALTGKVFHDCTFVQAHAANAVFIACKFLRCKFIDSDLSNATIKRTTWCDPEFERCKLLGVNWTAAAVLVQPVWVECVLNYANFSGMDLRKARWERCVAHEVDFADANIEKAVCRGTDFESSRFSNTNMREADFCAATNYAIRPGDNTLTDAKFSLPDATALLYGLDIILE